MRGSLEISLFGLVPYLSYQRQHGCSLSCLLQEMAAGKAPLTERLRAAVEYHWPGEGLENLVMKALAQKAIEETPYSPTACFSEHDISKPGGLCSRHWQWNKQPQLDTAWPALLRNCSMHGTLLSAVESWSCLLVDGVQMFRFLVNSTVGSYFKALLLLHAACQELSAS